jgi:hypothetical protein
MFTLAITTVGIWGYCTGLANGAVPVPGGIVSSTAGVVQLPTEPPGVITTVCPPSMYALEVVEALLSQILNETFS